MVNANEYQVEGYGVRTEYDGPYLPQADFNPAEKFKHAGVPEKAAKVAKAEADEKAKAAKEAEAKRKETVEALKAENEKLKAEVENVKKTDDQAKTPSK